MTLVWQQTSRTGSYDRGKWTGSTAYLIYDDAGASLTVASIRANASAAGTLVFGAGTETTMATLMEFTSASYSPVPDGLDKYWTGTHSFEQSLTIDGTAVEAQDLKQEKQGGFTCIEINAVANIVDIYRTGATLPVSDALKSAPSLIDIVGTPVDSAGDPISSIQGVLNISVRNVVIISCLPTQSEIEIAWFSLLEIVRPLPKILFARLARLCLTERHLVALARINTRSTSHSRSTQ